MWSCLPDHLRMQYGLNCDWMLARAIQVQMHSVFIVEKRSAHRVETLWDAYITFHTVLSAMWSPPTFHFPSFFVISTAVGWSACGKTNLCRQPTKQPIEMLLFSNFSENKYRLHLLYVLFIDCGYLLTRSTALYSSHEKGHSIIQTIPITVCVIIF